jgi:prefoldin subunit 5
MYEDVKQQLVEQASGLQRDIRAAEANLMILKESYLKVQGAMELLEHLKTEEALKMDSNEEENVEGNDS